MLRERENEVQDLKQANLTLDSQLVVNGEDLKQVKADRRELQKQLARLQEKHEELARQAQLSNTAAAASSAGGAGDAASALQEANYELQQQVLQSATLLQREDAELQRALGELSALAEANDDLARRLEASQRTVQGQEDDLILAAGELEAAQRARGEAEADAEASRAECRRLELDLSEVLPGLEREKMDLRAEVQRLEQEGTELRETALGGSLEQTVATIDELRRALVSERASAAALSAEVSGLREDREVLEQVIGDLSHEALGLAEASGVEGSGLAPGADPQSVAQMRHQLEVSRAANEHLGGLAREAQQELEALQQEQAELTAGDRGKAALVAEQKALRATLREVRRELEQALLRVRDGEEAKLHLEDRATALMALVKSRAKAAQGEASAALGTLGAREEREAADRQSRRRQRDITAATAANGAGAEAAEGAGAVAAEGAEAEAADEVLASDSAPGDEALDSVSARSQSSEGMDLVSEQAAAAAAVSAALERLVDECQSAIEAPLAAQHQTAAARLRAEVGELELQLADKDGRIAVLYDRLRDQAAALADAEMRGTNSSTRGLFPALGPSAAKGGSSGGASSTAAMVAREQKLAADLDSTRAELRRAQQQLAAGGGVGGGGGGGAAFDAGPAAVGESADWGSGFPPSPRRGGSAPVDLEELKKDIVRTVQEALVAEPPRSASGRPSEAPPSARTSADLEAQIEARVEARLQQRLREQRREAERSPRGTPRGTPHGTPRGTPRGSVDAREGLVGPNGPGPQSREPSVSSTPRPAVAAAGAATPRGAEVAAKATQNIKAQVAAFLASAKKATTSAGAGAKELESSEAGAGEEVGVESVPVPEGSEQIVEGAGDAEPAAAVAATATDAVALVISLGAEVAALEEAHAAVHDALTASQQQQATLEAEAVRLRKEVRPLISAPPPPLPPTTNPPTTTRHRVCK